MALTSVPVSARRNDFLDGDTSTGKPYRAFSRLRSPSTASDGSGVLPRK